MTFHREQTQTRMVARLFVRFCVCSPEERDYRRRTCGYRELFNASLADPNAFWADAAKAVTWTREPRQILDDSNPPFYRWFPDGELNTCANALDRHVEGGRGDQPALIYDSPVTGSQRTYTYRELLDETARFAGALRGAGRRTRATAS